MRGKQTTWLIVVALALFAFIWLFERHTPNTAQRAELAIRLFPDFNPATVRSVELTSSNLMLRAVRTGDAWTLAAPVTYPAQANAIESFLTLVADLTARQRITPVELGRQPHGLADYGLKPPQAILRIDDLTNRVELRLGALSPLGDRMYFQRGDQPDVFTAGSNFFSHLPPSADPWRDTALVQLDNLTFNRIEVRAPGRGFTVERDATNRLWRLTNPMAARADNAKIGRLLQQLRGWRTAGFVTDNPKADLEPFGLQTNGVELALGQGSNDVFVVQFGGAPMNNPDLAYARRLSHSNIVLVPRAPLEGLRGPFSDYRERRLGTLDVAAVDHVDIRAEDNFALRRDTNGTWRVIEPLNFSADAGIVTNLLVWLGSTDVTDFVKDVVTDFSTYGLAKPARRYVVRTSVSSTAGVTTNLTMLSVDIGTNAAGNVFARRADEESVYAISPNLLNALPKALFQVRDRRLWNFASSNVVAVALKNGGKERKLVRDERREWINAPGSSGDVNSLAIDSLLDDYAKLTALSWAARGAERKALFGFASPGIEFTVDVAVGEKIQKHSIELGGVTASKRAFAATQIEGEPIVFEIQFGLHQDTLRYFPVVAEGGAKQ